MRKTRTLSFTAPLVLAAALGVAAGPAGRGGIHEDVPATVDPAARYVVYLHGRIMETKGRQAVSPEFGLYDYDGVLRELAGKGLVVISEVRRGNAQMSYAKKVAAQVRRLEAGGVPARHITVAGFSKGGLLARATAAELGDPAVNFVLLAACGRQEADPTQAGKLKGRILSLYDESDEMAGSCQRVFAPGMETKEVKLTTGLRHGVFYRPRSDWVTMVAEWAAAP